jgi:hypothetical protein
MFMDNEILQEASKAPTDKAPVFDIVPGESINGMKLISPRLEVRKKMGKLIKSSRYVTSHGDIVYRDVFNGVIVTYNHRLYSELFQIYAGEARVRKFKIFPGTVKEFVRCFPDTYQTPDGWLSRDYSIGILENDGIVKELYVAYDGYYDD